MISKLVRKRDSNHKQGLFSQRFPFSLFQFALSALVAAAAAQLQLPAGVSASLCLDYPYCSQGNIPAQAQANPALR